MELFELFEKLELVVVMKSFVVRLNELVFMCYFKVIFEVELKEVKLVFIFEVCRVVVCDCCLIYLLGFDMNVVSGLKVFFVFKSGLG